jgi:8-oxo-dGTP pyrophosphatase MutT (NUDIX family)
MAASLTATALREAKEEIGCEVQLHPTAPRPFDIDVHRIPERPGLRTHLHLDLRFLLLASDPEQIRNNPSESIAAHWFSWEHSLAVVDDPALQRMLRKARRFCGRAAAGPA